MLAAKRRAIWGIAARATKPVAIWGAARRKVHVDPGRMAGERFEQSGAYQFTAASLSLPNSAHAKFDCSDGQRAEELVNY